MQTIQSSTVTQVHTGLVVALHSPQSAAHKVMNLIKAVVPIRGKGSSN